MRHLIDTYIEADEPTHTGRFRALMDTFMPNWQFHRAELNRLPLRHEEWGY